MVFIDFSLSEGKVVQVKSTESKKHMEVCTRVSVLWRYYREQKAHGSVYSCFCVMALLPRAKSTWKCVLVFLCYGVTTESKSTWKCVLVFLCSI